MTGVVGLVPDFVRASCIQSLPPQERNGGFRVPRITYSYCDNDKKLIKHSLVEKEKLKGHKTAQTLKLLATMNNLMANYQRLRRKISLLPER